MILQWNEWYTRLLLLLWGARTHPADVGQDQGAGGVAASAQDRGDGIMALGTQYREVFRAFGAEARIRAVMGLERCRLIAGLTPVPGAAEGFAPGGGVPPACTPDVSCVVHRSLPCQTRPP
jgi:hypothetical protein